MRATKVCLHFAIDASVSITTTKTTIIDRRRGEEAVFVKEWSQYRVPFGGGVASTDGQPTDTSAAVREESVSPFLEVPPLSELVQEEEVHGDISWMVDFAIIGNPKCGTTFLMVSPTVRLYEMSLTRYTVNQF